MNRPIARTAAFLALLGALAGCRSGAQPGAETSAPEATSPADGSPTSPSVTNAAPQAAAAGETEPKAAPAGLPEPVPPPASTEAQRLLEEMKLAEKSAQPAAQPAPESTRETARVNTAEPGAAHTSPSDVDVEEALRVLDGHAAEGTVPPGSAPPGSSPAAGSPAEKPPAAPAAIAEAAKPPASAAPSSPAPPSPAAAPPAAPPGGAPPAPGAAAPTVAAAPPVERGGAPQAQAQLQPQAAPEAKPKPARPAGKTVFYTFFHKTGAEYVRFLGEQFSDLVEKGHAVVIEGKPRSVMFFGDDATIQLLTNLANEYDDLDLKPERVVIRPKFIDVAVALEALNMAGVANVWNRVEENVTTNWLGPDGKVQKTFTHKQSVYSKGGLSAGTVAPSALPPRIPYVFEMPWTEPFLMPPVPTGKGSNDQMTVDFKNPASTEKRGTLVAVGTPEDLERIQAFIDKVDQPAGLVMIEVQLIELDASKFTDLGIDNFQFGERHTIFGGGFNLPGEPIPQPGIPGVPRRDPDFFLPPQVASGITGMFDDSSVDLSGRFMANIHLLVRTGDAKVKARPKILALDDRPSILHIGEEIPTFDSTGVSRELTGGNFVEQVNKVTMQYVGFTLNMRPRISGDEVSLLLEVVSNKLQARERVFAEDLLGIPNVTKRRFLGQTRVQNHRPIIIGGLIQEEESESVNKTPVLGELPVLKYLFSRRQVNEERIEVILILTPHILSDKVPDRIATPKESIHFDTFDSVLFNDRHIVKGRDVQGIDPITKRPGLKPGKDAGMFSEAEVVDLTLLKIVQERKLVSKLGIFNEYMPGEVAKLGWLQRRFPERSVRYWSPEQKLVYFKAAAIVIENIKELNPDLTYEDLVKPRREIVLPTTPYRMTLTYDKYKILAEQGADVLRGERVDLSQATVEILKEASLTRGVREFADFLEKTKVTADRHAGMRRELELLFAKMSPQRELRVGTYPDLYRQLSDAQIGFMVMATYFQDNLAERYRTIGVPDIGAFEKDVVSFLKTTMTIGERARRLRELDEAWSNMASEEEEPVEPEPGKKEP